METREAIVTELYKGKVKVKFFPASHQYWVSENGSTFKRMGGATSIIGIKDKSRALTPWSAELAADFLFSEYRRKGEITKDDVINAYIQHELYKDRAAALGTKIHDWCEQYINHGLGLCDHPDMPEDQNVLIGVSSFVDWAKKHKVKFVSSERIVYSLKHKFMGKMDIEALIDGERCLVDLKTSNGLYNSVSMQTAAYAKADEEENGKPYKGRWAIRISKETEEEYNKRMILKMEKNRAKKIATGRKFEEEIRFPKFMVFEARYLDEEKGNMERDFNAFLAAKTLFEWDSMTDFWKIDNAKQRV